MKKATSIAMLIVLVLLFDHYKAAAQCGQSGNTYYCFASASGANNNSGYYERWDATAGEYYISVHLEVYEDTPPNWYKNVGGEVFMDDFYWVNTIFSGTYDDSFVGPAPEGGVIQLSASAVNGEAYINADW